MPSTRTERVAWTRRLANRYGLRGAAERTGVTPDEFSNAMGTGGSPATRSTLAAIDRLMNCAPELTEERETVAWNDPRSPKTIPLRRYPDEEEYFGPLLAFKANRWRSLRKQVEQARREEDPSDMSLGAILAEENLLRIEIELLQTDGMTLGGERRHSSAVSAPALSRREQWEWRTAELADIVTRRERAERGSKRKSRLRRVRRHL